VARSRSALLSRLLLDFPLDLDRIQRTIYLSSELYSTQKKCYLGKKKTTEKQTIVYKIVQHAAASLRKHKNSNAKGIIENLQLFMAKLSKEIFYFYLTLLNPSVQNCTVCVKSKQRTILTRKMVGFSEPNGYMSLGEIY